MQLRRPFRPRRGCAFSMCESATPALYIGPYCAEWSGQRSSGSCQLRRGCFLRNSESLKVDRKTGNRSHWSYNHWFGIYLMIYGPWVVNGGHVFIWVSGSWVLVKKSSLTVPAQFDRLEHIQDISPPIVNHIRPTFNVAADWKIKLARSIWLRLR